MMEAVNAFAQFAPPEASQPGQKKTDALGQEEFMRLLVTQLENQDPTKPMDNFEFISQIAQFGMVSGIQESQQALNTMTESLFSNRVLQATELVGRRVLAGSDTAVLTEGEQIRGVVELPEAASSVAVSVVDAAGQLVRTLQFGPGEGRLEFSWDGLDSEGEPVPGGLYGLVGHAVVEGVEQSARVLSAAKVSSISVGASGTDIDLHLENGNTVPVSSIQEFL